MGLARRLRHHRRGDAATSGARALAITGMPARGAMSLFDRRSTTGLTSLPGSVLALLRASGNQRSPVCSGVGLLRGALLRWPCT